MNMVRDDNFFTGVNLDDTCSFNIEQNRAIQIGYKKGKWMVQYTYMLFSDRHTGIREYGYT